MSKKMKNVSLLDSKILVPALSRSFLRLNPKSQISNPVMFVVWLGASICTLECLRLIIGGHSFGFELQISIWLWFTLIFANFSEALAEGRGKAQADSLRKTRSKTKCKKIVDTHSTDFTEVDSTSLKIGDLVVCEAGDLIPQDGEVIDGIASIDESAITGESAPVVRESGGDRSSVTGGTRVLSDRIAVRITAELGSGFIDKMIELVEGAERKKTPNEVALSIVLVVLTLLFIVVVVCLKAFGLYAGVSLSWVVLIALLVCLIPTTIGGLLSAIGISGMDRLLRRNIIALSGRAVEAAGDVNVLMLDKTGTITLGNRMASEFIPVTGVSMEKLAHTAYLSSCSDGTAEGRSIVKLAQEKYLTEVKEVQGDFIEFSAKNRMSGLDFKDEQNKVQKLRKGAADTIKRHVESLGGEYPAELENSVQHIASEGGTPLVVSHNEKVLGAIFLKDIIKPGIRSRFQQLRNMGIKTVMITGDNPVTAASIAAEAGVDDFLAEATPEAKLDLIKAEKDKGNMVAMVGDGTNDAPALAQADVGLAMNTGTPAAKEAANMVDLDSDPTKLIETVEIGKQLLMTRGALTTFSLANDVAKYFAIIPALFASAYVAAGSDSPPVLDFLNVMHLRSPESAILSSIIFNALVIIALLPLALRGVKYEAKGAVEVFQKNFLIYGAGGVLAPFVFIKLIDVCLNYLNII